MTEAEWDACADPRHMLALLRLKVGDRKLRLFLCACCRRVWDFLPEANRRAVEVAERSADWAAISSQPADGAAVAAMDAADAGARALEMLLPPADHTATAARLLRCLFPNPFRPAPAVDPAWLVWNGCTVAKLAAAIYDGRLFADLPILADALEDAGCNDAAILTHCRGGGEHVRGCWVVDLLTGRG